VPSFKALTHAKFVDDNLPGTFLLFSRPRKAFIDEKCHEDFIKRIIDIKAVLGQKLSRQKLVTHTCIFPGRGSTHRECHRMHMLLDEWISLYLFLLG
jgi:hypothetical protein